MKLLDEYFEIQKQIYNYFGYIEDWVVIPLNDCRDYYWRLTGEKHGDCVYFSENNDDIINNPDDVYANDIYTQRFLPKWVYRSDDYTMVCVDTNVDGNKFLSIFDNSKEIK